MKKVIILFFLLSICIQNTSLVAQNSADTYTLKVLITDFEGQPTIEISDLDADGDLDIIATSRAEDKVTFYEKLESGRYASGVTIAEGNSNNGGTYLMTMDVNCDGKLDIVTDIFLVEEELFENNIVWYENLGENQFGNQNYITHSNTFDILKLSPIDVNNDSILDLTIVADTDLIIYKNSCENPFSEVITVQNSLQTGDFTVVDLNDDDFPDIVISDSNGYMYFQNNQGDQFASAEVLEKIDNPLGDQKFSLIDIDNDEDLDIVHLTNFGEGIYMIENLEDNNFYVDKLLIDYSTTIYDFEIYDVNLDGYTDIVSLSTYGIFITYGEQDGDFTQENTQYYQNSDVPGVFNFLNGSLSILDLDGDDDIDIIPTPSNRIMWFENTSTLVSTEYKGVKGEINDKFLLKKNYPNPFNPATLIQYSIPESDDVNLTVFSLLGQRVDILVDERKNAGSYSVRFDASGLSSGIYFYVLETDQVRLTKKMTLIK